MSKPDFDKVSEQIAVEIRKNIQIGSKHFASELQSYLSSNIECMFNEGRKAQMKVDAEIAKNKTKWSHFTEKDSGTVGLATSIIIAEAIESQVIE